MKPILLIALLTACGADPSNEPKASPTPTGGISYQPDSPKEVVVEYKKDGDKLSVTVSDTAELPPCERANSGQTAWNKTTDQSFGCNDGAWVEIAKEPPTESQPEIAHKGLLETKVEPPPTGVWVDPIAGQSWVLGLTPTEVELASIMPCSGDWRLPTRAEAKTAIQHGLPIAADVLTWTSEFTLASERIAVAPNGIGEVFGSLVTTARVACVKVGGT